MKPNFVVKILMLLLLVSAAAYAQKDSLSVDYNSFKRLIKVIPPSKHDQTQFSLKIKAKETSIKKNNNQVISGYKTSNRLFVDQVITPMIKPYLPKLAKMPKTEMINNLVLFVHELYITYFGKDFYRWGGDILDLDDPQTEDYRYNYKYGLDCSGFTASAYELAVFYKLLKPEDEGALFSSKGFELFCKRTGLQDKGGRGGTSNNFRLDTRDLILIGREVFTVRKGAAPTDEQLALLQPGDIVIRDGHVGIIVFINKKPYFLESGGYVLPKKGGLPYPAGKSIEMFANDGELHIKRALADDKPIAEKAIEKNTEKVADKNTEKVAVSDSTDISVSLPDTLFEAEGEYVLPVHVTGFNNIGAISIKLEFDSTVVRYRGLVDEPKNFMAGSRIANSVNIGWFDITGNTPMNFGAGDLFFIKFYYTGKGSTKIKFSSRLRQTEIADGTAHPLKVKFGDGSIGSK